MSTPSLTPRIWTEIGLLGLIWGGSFLAVKLALIELPVTTVVAHRVFWAAVLLWLYILWRGLPLPGGLRVWAALAVMGILNNALPFSLMAWGQQFIETGLTAIFNAATAVFAVLVAAVVFKDERLTGRRATGVALAFTGVLTTIGITALTQFDPRSVAQLATLGGALSYAFAAAWGRAHLGAIRPEVAAAVTLSTASLVLVPIAIGQHGPPRCLRPRAAIWASALSPSSARPAPTCCTTHSCPRRCRQCHAGHADHSACGLCVRCACSGGDPVAPRIRRVCTYSTWFDHP